MLLSFSANKVPSKILEATLIGRKETVNQIENELIEKVTQGMTYQSLLVAPRGSGKTHITSVIYHRIKSNPILADIVVVAYMNEDERGIANFSDFIRHILLSFEKHKEGNYQVINELISEVSFMPDNEQENSFVSLLLDFLGDKKLVLLIENLNVIFNNKTGMGLLGQKKLRSLLHETNSINILATSQNLFHHIQNSKDPFYNFFNVKELKRLTFPQALEFIRVLINLEVKNTPNSETSKKLLLEVKSDTFSGKVKAIYELTGGNYRLLVIFFDFLKAEVKADLSRIFEKAMNDLKPYYEQFLNVLSPQQQKIIKYLCSEHKPKMGKDISRFCFIKANTLSKSTSELVNEGFLDTWKVGKDSYYELKEALMRICFEITEHPSGIVKLFVNFLSLLYSTETLEDKCLELIKNSFTTDFQQIKGRTNSKEVQMYVQALPPNRREKLDFILNSCQDKESLDEAISSLNFEREIQENDVLQNIENIKKKECLEISVINKKDVLRRIKTTKMLTKHHKSILHKEIEHMDEININSIINTLKNFDDLLNKQIIQFQPINKIFAPDGIKYILKNKEIEKVSGIYLDLGLLLSFINQLKLSQKVLEKAIILTPKKARIYSVLGYNYYNLKLYDKSIEASKKAIKFNNKNAKYYSNLGILLRKTEKYKEAIEEFKKAIKLESKNFKYHYNLGYTYMKLDSFTEASESFQKAVEYNSNEGHIYFELARASNALNLYNSAIEHLEKAIKLESDNVLYYSELANTYYKLKNYEKSIELYNQAINLDAKSATLYFYRAISLYSSGELKASISDFEKAIELNPNNPNYYSLLAQVHDDNIKAIFYHRKAVKLDESNLSYRFELSDALYYLKNYNEALIELEKILEISNNNITALMSLGKTYFSLKNFNEALAIYSNVIELNPDNSEAYHMLGKCFIEKQEFENAITYLKKTIELKPNHSEYYTQIGNCLFGLKKYDQALLYFKKALKLNPKDLFNRLYIGYVYFTLKDFDTAIKEYESIIQIDPENADAHHRLGEVYLYEKNFQKARVKYKKVIELEPNNAEFRFHYANSLSSLNKDKEAIIEFEKSLELNPNNINTLINIGHSYFSIKNYNEAIKKFAKVIEIKPNNIESYRMLSLTYKKNGQIKEAINNYYMAIQLNPENARIHYYLGSDLYELKEYDDALKELNMANKLEPNNIDTLLGLGNLLTDRKEYDKARDMFNQIIDIQPSFIEAHHRLATIFTLQEKFDEAIISLKNSIAINPKESSAYILIGINLSLSEKYDQANNYYKKGIVLNTKRPEYYFSYGSNLLALSKYEEAINEFKKAIKINPSNERYLNHLAKTYTYINKYESSSSVYKKMIELYPKNDKYYFELANCYSKLKKYKEALEITKQAAVLNDKKNANICNSLGILYLKVNEIKNGRKEFENGLKLEPKNWFLNGSWTNLLIIEGRFDQAKSQFEAVYEITDFEKNSFESFIFEDNFYPLLKFSDVENIKKYLIFLKKYLIDREMISSLWRPLSSSIFNILINIEDYSSERIELIKNILITTFGNYAEATIPLMYLEIGVKYLSKNDKSALYEFSKEERKVFEEFVLNERNIFI
ncbi:hypothetical protein DIS18_08745 [Algibacter marinivivus]|uniref:Uncharacterized protein n=1 Tax=Algibacter marinivivus TaxID=2100723 RepID=A0A2U2X3H4_9FLAO|nr:ATP-binding protein [Algibacter marinivivus]PWH82331.1 hypothetical protein DIS18_08745 [Algibacter marinivivus]